MSTSYMSLLLSYPKTLGDGRSQFESHSLLSRFPPLYHGFLNIKINYQRIQTTCSHHVAIIVIVMIIIAMLILCYFIMSHATLILFHHAWSMLALQIKLLNMQFGCRKRDITEVKDVL